MALVVGVKALRARRRQLYATARTVGAADGATEALLLFYAAECGLKEKLLNRRGHRDSSRLEPTHDLRRLAKELRLPRYVSDRLDQIQNCRLRHPASGSVTLPHLHQAWRYGAKLDDADEKRAVEVLAALINWCEQE